MNLAANTRTLAHTQTVHRILMSRKTLPSTDLRRNANYIQEHENIQIQKQSQKIFWFPNSHQGTEGKCVRCLLLTISSMPQHDSWKHLTYKIQPFIYENSKNTLCCCCHTQVFDHSSAYTEWTLTKKETKKQINVFLWKEKKRKLFQGSCPLIGW